MIMICYSIICFRPFYDFQESEAELIENISYFLLFYLLLYSLSFAFYLKNWERYHFAELQVWMCQE